MKPHAQRCSRVFHAVRVAISAVWLAASLLVAVSGVCQTVSQATTVPLLLPGGLAFDPAGNLIFAESGSHAVRQVTPAGTLTLVAGTGVQGFAGDGGPAVNAELDSPAAVAVGSQGDLFIADTHNHRIRRVDAATGIISTFAGTGSPGTSPDGTSALSARLNLPVALAIDSAGNLFFADARDHLIRRVDATTGRVRTIAGSGLQGFSGDGGPAMYAALDSPYGIALDSAGNLFLADTHNERIRRVDAATGIIITVAGTGLSGFTGDQSAAASARLALPRGLAADAQGNLFLVDSANQRIRRVDAATGQISTIAGAGTQGFAGDDGPAPAALINAPRAIALGPGGLPTLADTGNGRLRQVDAAGVIHTYAGLGAVAGEQLSLSAPAVIRYGTGTLTAALRASPATGAVTLFEDNAASLQPLASAALNGNIATFSTAALAAGDYRLEATYAGDTGHPPAASGVVSLNVSPAPATATPDAISLLYGQPIPNLTGTLSGILPQDAAAATLSLTSAAAALLPPGTYAISATLTGQSAGNYVLTTAPAAVAIAKAPALATLTSAPGTQTLATHVATTTAGAPSGVVTLLDGTTPAASQTLTSAGDAVFSTSGLSTGTHTLTAAYQGNTDFLPATSAPLLVTIAPASAADFTLAAAGPTALTVPAGAATQFAFTVTPVNGPLSSPIVLSASGLPRGAVATFSPAYLVPSSSPSAFTMAVQTPRAALDISGGPLWALLIPVSLLALVRRRRMVGVLTLLVLTTGCGNRIYTAPAGSGVSYNVTVTATATGTGGAVLVHTVTVVMTVD